MEFHERLYDVRKKAGMTQTELAEKLGVSKSVISAYEKGIRNPSYKILRLLADTFNVCQLYFFEQGRWEHQPLTVDITDLNLEQQKIVISLVNEFKEINKNKEN